MEYAQQLFGQFFGADWGSALFSLTKNLVLILAIVLPLLLSVAYLTLAAVSYTHLTLPTKLL
jgi:NADH-quinone oxidoreductase subunit H